MKKLILILLLLCIVLTTNTYIHPIITIPTNTKSSWDILILKVMKIESNNNHKDYLYGNNVVGPLQISIILVKEINNTFNTNYTYLDRLDSLKSIELFNYYQSIYNIAKNDTLALRLWNAGPKGLKQSNYFLTNKYIKKVLNTQL